MLINIHNLPSKKNDYSLSFKLGPLTTLFLEYVHRPVIAVKWAVNKGKKFDRVNVYDRRTRALIGTIKDFTGVF